MSEDRLFKKAFQLYKEGNLEGAKAILEELSSPQAANALNRVNSAIAAKKQEALANRTNAPEYPVLPAKKPKAKPKANPALLIVAVLVLCGACWLLGQGVANQGKGDADLQRIQITSAIGGLTDINLTRVDVLHRADGYSLVMVTYNSNASNETDMYREYGSIIGIVGSLTREEAWDFDELAMVVGDRNGNTLQTVSVAMSDIIAYLNGEIDVRTLDERMTITDF